MVVGDLSWDMVGINGFDLIASLFGDMSPLSRIVYAIVGLSALWQIVRLAKGQERA